METIKIKDIKISELLKGSHPSQEKIAKKKKAINKGKYSPILLGKKNELKDGYITYLILKELYGKEYEVKVIKEEDKKSYKNQTTLYVYGKHPNPKNQNMDKEYVFRVKGSILKFKDLEEGDYVLVQTKYGLAPLRVTRCEILDKPPIEGKIKVIKKKICFINTMSQNTEVENDTNVI